MERYKKRLIKHTNNRDIAFKVADYVDFGDYYVVFGNWYNIVNPDNVYFIDFDDITIKKSDLDKWEEINAN